MMSVMRIIAQHRLKIIEVKISCKEFDGTLLAIT